MTIRTGSGVGSGVVFRPDVVLTNAYVVGDAREIMIEYADGESSPGTVLATDRITDIAVVRTERGDLLIQTDAPVSQGNSGGALVDSAGRVIDINEAYIPPAAGAVALGFAIPAGPS